MRANLAEIAQAKKERMEAKLRKAEEKRKEMLDQRIKKAHEEDEKVCCTQKGVCWVEWGHPLKKQDQ